MIMPLFVLYAVSCLATGLVCAFAFHNRTKGWVRQRRTVMDDLINLQMAYDAADWKESAVQAAEALTRTPRPVYRGRTREAAESEFTHQLVSMQLGAGTMTTKPAEETTPNLLIAGRG
jgi:hypothetical protein